MSEPIDRSKIDRLEVDIMRLPKAEIEIIHHFAPGIYCREMRANKGAIITGKRHLTRHLNIVSAGIIHVYNELGELRMICAPETFVSEPGTRRAAIVHSDTVWTTIHPNPDNETDVEKLEAMFVEPHENPLIAGMEQPPSLQSGGQIN